MLKQRILSYKTVLILCTVLVVSMVGCGDDSQTTSVTTNSPEVTVAPVMATPPATSPGYVYNLVAQVYLPTTYNPVNACSYGQRVAASIDFFASHNFDPPQDGWLRAIVVKTDSYVPTNTTLRWYGAVVNEDGSEHTIISVDGNDSRFSGEIMDAQVNVGDNIIYANGDGDNLISLREISIIGHSVFECRN